MYIDPTVYQGRPSDDRIPQELAVYDKLEELGISFTRVDHDHADTWRTACSSSGPWGPASARTCFCATGSRLTFTC